MPTKCYICNYYDSKRSLYRIPSRNDEYCERASLWLKLLNEKQSNVHSIRICSIHFFKSKLFILHFSRYINHYCYYYLLTYSNSFNTSIFHSYTLIHLDTKSNSYINYTYTYIRPSPLACFLLFLHKQ